MDQIFSYSFLYVGKSQTFIVTRLNFMHQMVSNSQEIDINFDEKKDVKIESFGSLLENSKPC